jgi:hypothetical protein
LCIRASAQFQLPDSSQIENRTPHAANISVAILAVINITVITSELSKVTVNMLSQKVQYISSLSYCVLYWQLSKKTFPVKTVVIVQFFYSCTLRLADTTGGGNNCCTEFQRSKICGFLAVDL